MRGSIKKIGKNKYRLVYDLPPVLVDGKLVRKQKKEVFYGTKVQAEDYLADIITKIKSGLYINDTGKTVAEYLREWFNSHKNKLAYRTAQSYRDTIEMHLIPGLGHHKLIDLRPIHIQEYYQSKDNLSSTTVLYHHRVLSAALRQATRWELIPRNPASGVVPPQRAEFEGVRLTPREVFMVLEETRDSIMYMPIVLAAFLGARRGEICALTWSDIDFTTKTINIRHSLKRIGNKLEVGPTKTHKERMVAMGDYLSSELSEHLEKQQRWFGAAGIPTGFVCCWEDGRPLDPDYVSKQYKKILRRLGLNTESRFHDLRHNFATLSLRAVVHPRVVSEMLGHDISNKDISQNTTNKYYSHVEVEMQRELAAFIESEYLKGSLEH